jgi:hypothetical protein
MAGQKTKKVVLYTTLPAGALFTVGLIQCDAMELGQSFTDVSKKVTAFIFRIDEEAKQAEGRHLRRLHGVISQELLP